MDIDKDILREKIETLIEEYRESIPEHYTHHREEAGYEESYVIRGLQAVLDIIEES